MDLPCVHQVKAFVDLIQGQFVGDHRVDLDLAVHVPIDDLWDVRAALGPAKRGAAPDAACDQLEGTGGNFGTCGRHADDDAFTPAFVRGLKGVRITLVLPVASNV